MRLFSATRARLATACAIVVVILSLLQAGQVSTLRAQEDSEYVWVLAETLINPDNAQTEFYGGGATPNWFGEARFEGKHLKYAISEVTCRIDDREVDHGYVYHDVSIQVTREKPPAMLVPGDTLALEAVFSHDGTLNKGGSGTWMQFWYSSEDMSVQPDTVFAYAPWDPNFGGTTSATYTVEVPPASSGGEIALSASVWNNAPCLVTWRYRAVLRSEAEEMLPPETGDTDTGDTGSGSGTGTGTGETGDTGSGSGTGTDTRDTGDTGSNTADPGAGQPQPPGPVVQGSVCGVYTGVSVAPGSTAAPWETAAGQNCFERWIREATARLNAYNGTDDFNARKPWSINEFGLIEGNPQFGPTSVAAPDDFGAYNNNKYWYMWDGFPEDSIWDYKDENWQGAQVPPLRAFVLRCLAETGGTVSDPTGSPFIPGITPLSTIPGADFAPPPYGAYPEPAPVGAMALQAGQRRVPQGALVYVPVYLLNGANVANMNFNLIHDNSVARPEGDLIQGWLLGQSLFEYNTGEPNRIRVGFAQQGGIYGTGPITYVPFRAVGQPGSRTDLCLEVTTVNDPNGTVLPTDRIHGFVEIVNPDGSGPSGPGSGVVQGDCIPDGVLDERDAACALQMSVNLRPPQPWIDMDGSGDVTSRDATIILQQANVSRAGR